MHRRKFLQSTLVTGAAGAFAPALAQSALSQSALSIPTFELEETTIPNLQSAMQSGKLSAHSLAQKYLERIAAIDKHGPAINSIIELNPDALAIADELDKERNAKGPRGPMHGIPVLIKDNIDTADRFGDHRWIARDDRRQTAEGRLYRAATARCRCSDPRQDKSQ